MRLLVFGSRKWKDARMVRDVIQDLCPDLVVHGAARGADMLAGQAAKELGIPQRAYPANWDLYGRSAGPIRNQQMLDEEHPDMAVGFRVGGPSPGTDDMARRVGRAGITLMMFESMD